MTNAVGDGITRLANFAAANAHQKQNDFIRALHGDLVAHASGIPQPDDLTVLIIKRTAPDHQFPIHDPPHCSTINTL